MTAAANIGPDEAILWSWGPLKVNATLACTWILMALLVVASATTAARVRRRTGSRWQGLLEMIVDAARRQIEEVVEEPATPYLPFIGSLFLFIAGGNLLMVVPGYVGPMSSLSTTAALALCVFFAVPVFGIRRRGLRGYLGHYLRPSPLMLPFHVISELTRTLALAVRLFGNVMSGARLAALILAIAPLAFPVVMQALGLLTSLIQAYIFAILALIYIASAVRAHGDDAQAAEARSRGG